MCTILLLVGPLKIDPNSFSASGSAYCETPPQDEQEDVGTGQGAAEEALVAERPLEGRRPLRGRGGSRRSRRRGRGGLQVQGDGRLAHVGDGLTRFRF